MNKHNVMLDSLGYPVGQKWCCCETPDGYIAVLVANHGNLNTSVLEGIALTDNLSTLPVLNLWSQNLGFTLSVVRLP